MLMRYSIMGVVPRNVQSSDLMQCKGQSDV